VRDLVRIGAGSGFARDSAVGVSQMLAHDPPDYLIFEQLAEQVMVNFLQEWQRSPDLGYSSALVDVNLGPYLGAISAAGVKVITNGGGLRPHAAAAALQRLADQLGLRLKIAVVEGDNLNDRLGEFSRQGYCDMFTGEAWPENLVAAHAYMGAFPIAAALDMGADIVITGRVVDSALTLGPLIHEFGWNRSDYDKLAAGTVAGHILECGGQATGGTFTDYCDIPDTDNIGFPIAECRPDGTFVVTKPEGTGGLVSIGTVSEQLLYEVSDPAAYLVPDVVCDVTEVRMAQLGPDRVEVTGARGMPPSGFYKVCGMVEAGWRVTAMHPVIGIDAVAKARRMADGLLARANRLLEAAKLPPWSAVQRDIIGAGELFAAWSQGNMQPSEVVSRIVVIHDDIRGANVFRNEYLASLTNGSPGTIGTGTPPAMPVHRLFSFLLRRDSIAAVVTYGDAVKHLAPESAEQPTPAARPRARMAMLDVSGDASVPLIALAWGRSGDKGNLYNIGIIARRFEYLPYIRSALSEEAVSNWLRHTFDDPSTGRVRRYDVPGINALNFVAKEALRGGGAVGLSLDANAKGMAQQLLQMPVAVPAALAAKWDGVRL